MARKSTQKIENEEVPPKQCCWNVLGSRCQNTGIISETVLGFGPWYCRDHWADLKGQPRLKIPPDSEPMSEVDKRVNKIVPRRPGENEHDWSMRCKDYVLAHLRSMVSKPPNKDWAHRIIAKHNNGEEVQHYSLKLAREALDRGHMREPGED
jgi:hypothetical protein